MLYKVSNTLLKTPYSGNSDHKKELCVKMIYRLTALINAESSKKGLPRTNYREYNNPSSYSLEALEREVWLYVRAYSHILNFPSMNVPEELPLKTVTIQSNELSGDAWNTYWVDPDGLWTYTINDDNSVRINLTGGKSIPEALDYSDMPYEVLIVGTDEVQVTYMVTSYDKLFMEKIDKATFTIRNWTNQHVTDMDGIFTGSSSLTSFDLSNFNTSSVTNMRIMFNRCSSLESLDLSNFDTSKVTNMGGMFQDCSSLTSLDLSNFDTSKVTDMGGMFFGCSSLTGLNLSDFDTSSVTNMNGMFNGCSSLTSLDLSNFNTSSVTNMSYMFNGCSSLASLDLSSFNTSNVNNMSNMFSGYMRSMPVGTTKVILTLGSSFSLSNDANLLPPTLDDSRNTLLPLELTCNETSYDTLRGNSAWAANLTWNPTEWINNGQGLCTFNITPNA